MTDKPLTLPITVVLTVGAMIAGAVWTISGISQEVAEVRTKQETHQERAGQAIDNIQEINTAVTEVQTMQTVIREDITEIKALLESLRDRNDD